MKKANFYPQVCSLLFMLIFMITSITSCGGQPGAKAIESKHPASISQTLKNNDHLPVEQRVALYHRLKRDNPDGYNFENEDELTMYGYSLLWSDKVTDAIEIFKLIVSQFPNSSNPYDSLGEGYMVNGDMELAIANYEKSLKLNPDNFNAEDQIDRIKYPNKVQETAIEKFVKVFSMQAYKDDLDQLGRRLTEVHPNALKFIAKDDFWNIIDEKKALITAHTTYSEFAWHCSEIIASLNCSHTSAGLFFQEHDMPVSLRFPLQVRWENNQLFVIDPLNNADQVKLKGEILTINEIPVHELIRGIYKHIPSQGYIETAKKHSFNRWASGMIPYALGFPESYEIRMKGKENLIVLKQTTNFKNPMNDSSIQHCEDDLCLEFTDNDKNAILTISSFNYYPWGNLTFFKDFIDDSFKEMDEKGTKNLIIDLRFNGGGSPESSIYLLKYLVDKPFIYATSDKYGAEESPFENSFKGKRFFIIDGNGKSTTGHFMSLAKVLDLGTIVGEELGSNQFCSAGQTICRLSNTKMEYYVANNTHETTATSLPDEMGILPDHHVQQSIDDYLNNVDAVKEYTLKLTGN